VAGLVAPWRSQGISKVCGIESRGFILGGAVASVLGVGFVAIRKPGNLFPGPKHEVEAAPDYRGTRHILRIQQRSVQANDRVLLVDDWIECGSQAAATRDLIEACGAVLIGVTVLVDQREDDDRVRLPRVTSILNARDLPAERSTTH
jgi:adenine phosphoribosyltransferase